MQDAEDSLSSSPGGGLINACLEISVDGQIRQIKEVSQIEDDSHEAKKGKQSPRLQNLKLDNGGEDQGETVDAEQKNTETADSAEVSGEKEDDLFFLRKTKSLTGSITIANSSQPLTIDVEQLVADMSHPVTGVQVKDRKWRLKTYKKCFVGTEAIDWLVSKLGMVDREDAVSVGQELMRLQFFCHVCDDKQEFRDDYLFYNFMVTSPPVQCTHRLRKLGCTTAG